jgi:hypothetical protein
MDRYREDIFAGQWKGTLGVLAGYVHKGPAKGCYLYEF